MNDIEGRQERIAWLDSLRGIAAVMVAIMHLWEMLYATYFQEGSNGVTDIIDLIVLDGWNWGKSGVVVFFIVSGYVIPFSLKGKGIRNFCISRFFRLYPAYWLSIVLIILVAGLPPISFLIGNITMVQRFMGIPDMIGVYWTLQIELIFYIICCILFYKKISLNGGGYFFVIGLGLACSFIVSAVRYVMEVKYPVSLPLSLTLMFIGMQWRMCHDSNKYKPLGISILLFLTGLLPVCFLAYNKDYGFGETWYRYFISYSLGILIFYLFKKFTIRSRLLVFLGRISYSLYLMHLIVLNLTQSLVDKYKLPFLAAVSFFVLVSFVTSCLSFYLVERPSIRLGRKVISTRNGKRRS
jgi:peptidoglycan/LPS O-acetylase OafA/YrhL